MTSILQLLFTRCEKCAKFSSFYLINMETQSGNDRKIGLEDLQEAMDDFLNYYVLRRTTPVVDASIEEVTMENEKFNRAVTMLVSYFLTESEKDETLYGKDGKPDFMRLHLREMLKKHEGRAKGLVNPDNVEKVFYLAACKKMAELFNALSREHRKLNELIQEVRDKLRVR